MPFTLEHVLVSQRLDVERLPTPQGFFFTVSAQGTFLVLHPGRLQRDARASVRHAMRVDIPDTSVPRPPGGIDDPTHGGIGGHPQPPPGPRPRHNGVQVTVEGIPVDLQIRDPDGQLFTRDEVTLADLKRFRTARGASRRWSFSLRGTSRVYNPNPALNESVTDPQASIHLTITETIASSSAGPLVPRTSIQASPVKATFDLLRVGDFVANVVGSNFLVRPWRGSMRLVDPDGAEFARTSGKQLRVPIPLSVLGRSRDAAGKPRPWTLEVTPAIGGGASGTYFLSATVLAPGRINTGVLQSRIQFLFGADGTSVQFAGQNVGGLAKAIVTITDAAAAEAIDMHGLLDGPLVAQGESTDVNANVPMAVASVPVDVIGYGTTIDVGGLRTTSIRVTVAPAQNLEPGTPAIRLRVGVAGVLKIRGLGQTLATASLRGGVFEMEIGLRIDPDGTPRVVTWLPDQPFDIDFNEAAIAEWVAATTASLAAGGSLFGPLGTVIGAGVGLIGGVLSVAAFEAAAESYTNGKLVDGVAKLLDDPTLAPRILMMMLGAHMSYLPIRFQGNDVLFEHVAPVEPDPKPRQNYAGAIGRSLRGEALGHPVFFPASLGDTWAAANLKAKIQHIVVVMMENRSYDHVLGSRSLAPATARDAANGWTPDLMAAVNARAERFRPARPPTPPQGSPPVHFDRNPPVHPLRDSAFAPNALGLRTRLPKPVGHGLADVTEQLAGQIEGPGGRKINDPAGFINNFRTHSLGNNPHGNDLDDPPRGENVVVPFDVLRFYETNENVTDASSVRPGNDLPMSAFLASRYSYCDNYFCSHAGPTLPNRMYSVTGDVQYDRYGFPILDNNDGDNFLLSRAQTINDVLTREGVSWKVYESEPSVTMLRMFARYAGDNVNIRPISELEHDFVVGNVPSVVVIEPAMHHQPADDDHPDADMYRGQHFLRRVYSAVTANPQVWARTLLIITYDEHGGFYDHVVPPVADVFQPPRPVVAGAGTLGGAASGGGSTTAPPVGPGAPGALGGPGGVVHGAAGLHINPDLLGVLSGERLEPVPGNVPVKVPYGVRVPTFVVSPWVSPGKGPSVVLDHCSIVKTILARFCGDKKPFLNDRVHVSRSFESFLTESAPRAVPPPAAPPLRVLQFTSGRRISGSSRIDTRPLFRKRMREEQVDYHEVSGRLARMLGR
jgi:phospholipase C